MRCRVGLIVLAFLPLLSSAAGADAHSDPQALRVTRRIAVIAPFFCTGPLQELIAQRTDDGLKGSKPVVHLLLPGKSALSAHPPRLRKDLPPAAVKLEPTIATTLRRAEPLHTPAVSPVANTPASAFADAFYRDALKSLAEVMDTSLPDRLHEGGRFTVVPAPFTQKGLYSLHWRASDLFLPPNGARAGFPTPDIQRIQQLARKLHVDAVFVGTMREPASIGDGLRLPFAMWQINPLNLGMKRTRAHVLSPRVRAFLITAQGNIAWQDEQMADHPRTTPHTMRTLLVDWQEATEQAVQQLADSLHALSQNVPGEKNTESKKAKG